METRSEKLLEAIRRGLAQHSARTTQTQLGDRSQYVGMSELGGFIRCPRATVLGKINGQPVNQSLSKLITLNRGHWFEDGIANALKALNVHYTRQLEAEISYEGIPFKAHFDFVLASNTPKPTVRILEVKSCQSLPEDLYLSYEVQVYGQVGLLHQLWNSASFSVVSADGSRRQKKASFPSLAQAVWGIELPEDSSFVDIETWVLCLSMTDAKVFGPYTHSEEVFSFVRETGMELWETTQKLKKGELTADNLGHANGFSPLCEHCHWSVDCPKFRGEDHPELEGDLNELNQWKTERSKLDTIIKAKEQEIKNWYTLSAHDDWIRAGNYRVRNSELPGRRTLDKDSLQEELESLFWEHGLEVDVPCLFARHEKEGEPFTRLFINKTNGV